MRLPSHMRLYIHLTLLRYLHAFALTSLLSAALGLPKYEFCTLDMLR